MAPSPGNNLTIPKPWRVRRRNEASQIGRRGRERPEQEEGHGDLVTHGSQVPCCQVTVYV